MDFGRGSSGKRRVSNRIGMWVSKGKEVEKEVEKKILAIDPGVLRTLNRKEGEI